MYIINIYLIISNKIEMERRELIIKAKTSMGGVKSIHFDALQMPFSKTKYQK